MMHALAEVECRSAASQFRIRSFFVSQADMTLSCLPLKDQQVQDLLLEATCVIVLFFFFPQIGSDIPEMWV
jgi:hypothetical protein